MKAHWTPITFAAVLGAGLLISSGRVRGSEEAAGNKSAAPVVSEREAPPVTPPQEHKFLSYAEEYAKLSEKDKEAFKKSMTPGDLAAAIELSYSYYGSEDHSWEARNMLDEILYARGREDFDGTWAWCRRIENDDTRKNVMWKLFERLIRKDLDRAVALYLEMTAEDPYFVFGVAPIELLKQAATKDAATFVDILGKLPAAKGGKHYAPMDFAVGFDFQKVADGYTAYPKNHQGELPAAYPLNLLTSWARYDADAAYAFYSKNLRDGHFGTFSNLLDGIDKRNVRGASSIWAADKLYKLYKLNEVDTDRDAMILSLKWVAESSSGNRISSIAQAMPDTASRDRFLGDVMRMNGVKYPEAEYNYTITLLSSSAVRLEALRQLERNDRLDVAKITDALRKEWGLSRWQGMWLQYPGNPALPKLVPAALVVLVALGAGLWLAFAKSRRTE